MNKIHPTPPADCSSDNKLQLLWQIELELADVLLDICKQYDLHIWAGYGTLIGAARHKGFIPWDDDLDFVMLRADYDKLIELINTHKIVLPTNMEFDLTNISGIKLRRVDTTMYSKTRRLSNNLSHGVWVDVFCLDVAPDGLDAEDIKRYEKLKKRIKLYNNAQQGYFAQVKNVQNILGHLYLKLFFLFGGLGKYRDKIENSLRDDAKRYSGEKVWGFLIWCRLKNDINKISIHGKSNYEETILMPFEDRFFPCPKNYDIVLTDQYGDWRTPVKGESQHEGSYVDIKKPYSEYIKETLRKMPWWKRYLYKH